MTGLPIAAGVTPSAQAGFTFCNDNGERVVVNLQRRSGSHETLPIDANRSQTYRCANGARDALLKLYTDDDSAADDDADDFLVSDQFHDAAAYALFRDAVGYAEVVRFR